MKKAEALIKTLPIESVQPNPWNPNEMDEHVYARLVDEIDENGFISPINVVPMEDGSYRIIGGEHRWRAAKELGYTDIQCVILEDARWSDEDLQKFQTVKLNILSGKVSSQKFMALYEDLHERHSEDAIAEMMAFSDEEAWNEAMRDVRRGLADSGLPEEALREFDSKAGGVKTQEQLEKVLDKILQGFEGDLTQNVVVFTAGGNKHLVVSCDEELWALITKARAIAKTEGVGFDGLLKELLNDVG